VTPSEYTAAKVGGTPSAGSAPTALAKADTRSDSMSNLTAGYVRPATAATRKDYGLVGRSRERTRRSNIGLSADQASMIDERDVDAISGGA